MKTLLQNSEKERDKCWFLFKTSFIKPLVAQFKLEPLFISFVSFFVVAAHLINFSVMEADCTHKLLRRPLCSTTECETGLFRQQAHKTPFYKHFVHYTFLNFMNF